MSQSTEGVVSAPLLPIYKTITTGINLKNAFVYGQVSLELSGGFRGTQDHFLEYGNLIETG